MMNKTRIRDPFSTPARRRRIIADLAKLTLKNYCITACDNVHRYRIEKKAAIIIQCYWRKWAAQSLLRILRFLRRTGAAIRIQAVWRGKLGKLLKRRLLELLYQKRCKTLVKWIEILYLQRKQREYQRYLRQQRLSRLRNQQIHATITIQAGIRGKLGRNRFHRLKAEYIRQSKAAVIIQRKWKTILQYRRFQRYKLRKDESMRIIYRYTYYWYRYHIQWKNKRRSCIRIQSVIRRFLIHRKLTYWKRMKYLMEKESLSLHYSHFLIDIYLTDYEQRNNPLWKKIFTNSSDSFSEEQVMLSSLLQWCITHNLLKYQSPASSSSSSSSSHTYLGIGENIEQSLQFFLSSIESLTPTDDVDTIWQSLSTEHPPKTYMITKRASLLSRYEHIYQLLSSELSLSISSASSSSLSNRKKESANSSTDMKISEESVLPSTHHHEIMFEEWGVLDNPSPETKQALTIIPLQFNRLSSLTSDLHIDSDGKPMNLPPLLLIQRFPQKVEIQIISPQLPLIPSQVLTPTTLLGTSSSSFLTDLFRMKKGQSIEILKTKEYWKITTLVIHTSRESNLASVLSPSTRPVLARVDEMPVFEEIRISLPLSLQQELQKKGYPLWKMVSFRVPLPEIEELLESPPVETEEEVIIEPLEIEEPHKEEAEVMEIPKSPTPDPTPIPSPPKIDYDHMARRIQRVASERYAHKSLAQQMIVYYYRRYSLLYRFRQIVHQAMIFIRPKVIQIQTIIRGYLAKCRSDRLYQTLLSEYEQFLTDPPELYHNFDESNEYMNWKRFGMTERSPLTETSAESEQELPSEGSNELNREKQRLLVELIVPSNLLRKVYSQGEVNQQTDLLPQPPTTAPTSDPSLAAKSTANATITPSSSTPPQRPVSSSSTALPDNDQFTTLLEGLLPQNNNSSSNLRTLADNDFISLAQMIEFPEIPPNCLLPFPLLDSGMERILWEYQLNPDDIMIDEKQEKQKEYQELIQKKQDLERMRLTPQPKKEGEFEESQSSIIKEQQQQQHKEEEDELNEKKDVLTDESNPPFELEKPMAFFHNWMTKLHINQLQLKKVLQDSIMMDSTGTSEVPFALISTDDLPKEIQEDLIHQFLEGNRRSGLENNGDDLNLFSPEIHQILQTEDVLSTSTLFYLRLLSNYYFHHSHHNSI